MTKVIVYTQPTCAPCHAETAWMREEGVAFEDRNIRENRDWLMELVDLGSQGTPTTVIESDGLREVIIGFDRVRLRRALQLDGR